MATPIKYVKILDKKVPWELIENYITVLWHYDNDRDRGHAHDAIFEYMDVNRYTPTDDTFHNKYADKLDDIICFAFVCCGQTVMRDNTCRGECGEKLTVEKSLINTKHYIRLKKLNC